MTNHDGPRTAERTVILGSFHLNLASPAYGRGAKEQRGRVAEWQSGRVAGWQGERNQAVARGLAGKMNDRQDGERPTDLCADPGR